MTCGGGEAGEAGELSACGRELGRKGLRHSGVAGARQGGEMGRGLSAQVLGSRCK